MSRSPKIGGREYALLLWSPAVVPRCGLPRRSPTVNSRCGVPLRPSILGSCCGFLVWSPPWVPALISRCDLQLWAPAGSVHGFEKSKWWAGLCFPASITRCGVPLCSPDVVYPGIPPWSPIVVSSYGLPPRAPDVVPCWYRRELMLGSIRFLVVKAPTKRLKILDIYCFYNWFQNHE